MEYTDTHSSFSIQAGLRAFSVALVASLFLAFANPQLAIGQACESAGDGNWGTASTWTNCAGGIPGSADDVVISSGDIVTFDVDATVSSLILEAGTQLGGTFLLFNNSNLEVSGDVTVNSNSTLGLENKDYGAGVLGGGVLTFRGNITSDGTIDGARDASVTLLIVLKLPPASRSTSALTWE